MTFVDKVKELKEDGSVSEDVISAAIDYCISHGILVSFFRENRKEIIHTMIIDATYENRLRLAKAEAERDRIELKAVAERGRIELRNEIDAKLIAGIRNLMQAVHIDQEQAMDLLLISGEDRERLAAVIAEQKKEPDSDE